MKKWILILLMVLMTTTAAALELCQTPTQQKDIPCTIQSTWEYPECNITQAKIYDSNGTQALIVNFTDFGASRRCNFTWNISTVGSYFWNVSIGDSGHLIIEQGDDEMASLGITIFILLIAGVVFFFAFKREVHPNKYANLIIKRSLLVLGIYLMILNSAIMATIAEAAGLELTKEMFFFMNLFGFLGYPAMILLMLSALIQSMREWKIDKAEKKAGGDYE